MPHYNTLLHVFARAEHMALLHRLLAGSALPLIGLEDMFAVDEGNKMDESLVVLLPSASMRYSDEELRRMKTRRRELVSEYGGKGQHHPMGRMIGGLNPAAQELHGLRGKIAEAESERRKPSPVLTPRPGSKGGYGLKFDIEYQGRRGKLGTDNFGHWYVIIGEGSEANVVASGFKTKGEAAKAFARLSAAREHQATKKSPAQLQREIDEVLARPLVQSSYSVHTPEWERERLVRKLSRKKA